MPFRENLSTFLNNKSPSNEYAGFLATFNKKGSGSKHGHKN